MSKYVDFMNTPDGVQRIFTYEKVIKMPKLKLKKDLWRIYEQLDSIGIPDKKKLGLFNYGKIFIWRTVNDNKVCAKCKSRDWQIFYNIQDIADDYHPNCRCYIVEVDFI